MLPLFHRERCAHAAVSGRSKLEFCKKQRVVSYPRQQCQGCITHHALFTSCGDHQGHVCCLHCLQQQQRNGAAIVARSDRHVFGRLVWHSLLWVMSYLSSALSPHGAPDLDRPSKVCTTKHTGTSAMTSYTLLLLRVAAGRTAAAPSTESRTCRACIAGPTRAILARERCTGLSGNAW